MLGGGALCTLDLELPLRRAEVPAGALSLLLGLPLELVRRSCQSRGRLIIFVSF